MDSEIAQEQLVQTTTGSNAVVCQTLVTIAIYFWIRELANLGLRELMPNHLGLAVLGDFLSLALPMTQTVSSSTGKFPVQLFCLGLFHAPTLVRLLLRKWGQLFLAQRDEEPAKALSGVAALEPYVVTAYRGIVVLFAAICMLGADFPFFPRDMAKTVVKGYSVMDLGVGAFVIASGLVAPQAKETGRSSLRMVFKEIQRSFGLILLGFGQSAFVTLINYQPSEDEYGKHWNFFCTVAVVKVFGTLAAVMVRAELLPLLGVGLLAGYEVILQNGLYDYLLVPSSEIQTNGFISRLIVDNRSGLASAVGFLALFLIWTQFGRCFRVIRKLRYEHFRLVGDLLCWCLLGVVLCHFLPVPSRRAADAAYVFWSSYVALGFLASLVLTRMMSVWLAENEKTEGQFTFNTDHGFLRVIDNEGEPLLQHLSTLPLSLPALNYNALAMLLLASVMTGVIRLCVDTVHAAYLESMLILTVYGLIICLVASMLYMGKVRLRFRISDGKSGVSAD